MTWWRSGVLYQVYPRSYADADGDGVGDVRGLLGRLDHLQWLGVTALWLNPVTLSPDQDWGYDVADYRAVQPVLGKLEDVDALILEAGRRGIRIVLDLVPNHTSDRHAWFQDARSGRTARHRDFYVWADPGPDGSPPNNWTSMFGGPAWTRDEASGQYYLHNFLPSQPDLNWHNPKVREAFEEILRFWFDRGVAGFRIDVAHMLVKDRALRDNPPATDEDHPMVRLQGQRPVHNSCQSEVHDIYRRWRALADSYEPPRLLLGETLVFDSRTLASFYGANDELHLGFNFELLHAPLDAPTLRRIVEAAEEALPEGAWPVWTLGNHDLYRYPSRWAKDNPGAARCALMMLLALRGTPCLYYGDELGMPDTEVPQEQLKDPVGIAMYPFYGRDPARTPMPWRKGPGAGFTAAGVTPWLPLGDVAACNVEDQQQDPGSMLRLCRDLLALRAATEDLRSGAYRTLPASGEALWAWQRGDKTVVALNLGAAPQELAGVCGQVRVATRRERDGERVNGALALGPWEGAVVSSAR